MRRFNNIAEFQLFLRDELPGLVVKGKRAGLEEGAGLILTEMKAEIGTYQSGDAGFDDMPALSPATLEGFGPEPEKIGKVPLGYSPPDNPLLREGFLRESLGKVVSDDSASIGSDDPVAIWQNEGTDSRGVPFIKGETTSPGIPAREFIGRAGFRQAPAVVQAIGENLVAYMTGAKK